MTWLIRIFLDAAAVLLVAFALAVAGLWGWRYSTAQYVGRTDGSGWWGVVDGGTLAV